MSKQMISGGVSLPVADDTAERGNDSQETSRDCCREGTTQGNADGVNNERNGTK